MVRQWQDMFDENTRNNVNIASPNYLKIAEAY
jgi:thiamine pyrophosphate-dependent acetolactate synthase large subunit-like protein